MQSQRAVAKIAYARRAKVGEAELEGSDVVQRTPWPCWSAYVRLCALSFFSWTGLEFRNCIRNRPVEKKERAHKVGHKAPYAGARPAWCRSWIQRETLGLDLRTTPALSKGKERKVAQLEQNENRQRIRKCPCLLGYTPVGQGGIPQSQRLAIPRGTQGLAYRRFVGNLEDCAAIFASRRWEKNAGF